MHCFFNICSITIERGFIRISKPDFMNRDKTKFIVIYQQKKNVR